MVYKFEHESFETSLRPLPECHMNWSASVQLLNSFMVAKWSFVHRWYPPCPWHMSYGSPNVVISRSLLMDPISPPYHERWPNLQAAVFDPSQPQSRQVAYTCKGKEFPSVSIVTPIFFFQSFNLALKPFTHDMTVVFYIHYPRKWNNTSAKKKKHFHWNVCYEIIIFTCNLQVY